MLFFCFLAINIMISFGVITILFGVIFKVLPDANIRWKDVRTGAFYGLSIYVGSLLIGFILT
jgi:membrane protein